MAKKGSVLVVDDEEIMREVLETLLSADGYRVDLAKTGEEGLEAYGRRAYDFPKRADHRHGSCKY